MNSGKKFETKFRKEWESTVDNSFLYRLIDAQGGYRGIRNISDFIAYTYPYQIIIECKEHEGNTFPLSAFRQFDDLKELYDKNITGLKIGVLLYLSDHKLTIWIPISTFIKLKNDDKKSFNVKMVGGDEYEHFVIPIISEGRKKTTNYKELVNYFKEN